MCSTGSHSNRGSHSGSLLNSLAALAGPQSGFSLRPLCTTLSISGCRSLRSIERGVLIVYFSHKTTRQNSAFSMVGIWLWNGLSLQLCLFLRVLSFYAHLRTVLLTVLGS